MLRLFKFQQEKIYKYRKRTFIYYYSFDAEFLNQLRGGNRIGSKEKSTHSDKKIYDYVTILDIPVII